MGVVTEARDLVTGLIDRWVAAKHAHLDAKALVRLMLLEARRNLEILDVAKRIEDTDSSIVLWEVAPLLRVEVIEAVLGQGDISAKAFDEVKKLTISEPDTGKNGADFLTSLYVRVTAVQSLALLNSTSPLKKVDIELRLKNMRRDFLAIVQALSKSSAT